MADVRLDNLRKLIADFPKSPGVYLMKDAEGRVLYVGKAKDLRSRVSSYFQAAADLLTSRGPDIARMVDKVVHIDVLECDSEVDALLKEARLIKDTQPPHNVLLKDDKTFPYIEITTGDDFPGVYVTRTPRLKGSRLYGPFPSAGAIRDAVNALQKVFKFRTCELEIHEGDESRQFFRPCLLHAINQCTAPCAALISKEDYRKDIDRLKKFMASKRSVITRQMTKEMEVAAKERRYEDAAKLRDRIKAIQSLELSGDVNEDVQPEVFFVDPRKGLEKLAELLGLEAPPRSMECIDIAHLQGAEMVGSLVCFIDGKPLKSRYRRFKINTVEGVDDYAAIREVITRRYRYAAGGEELYPDVILIDGGLGQLHAGLEAFEHIFDAPRPLLRGAEGDRVRIPKEGSQPPPLSGGDHGGVDAPALDATTDPHRLPPPLVRGAEGDRGGLRATDDGARRAFEPPPLSGGEKGGVRHPAGRTEPARRRPAKEGVRYVSDDPTRVLLRPPMVISLAKREEEVYIQKRTAPVRLSRNNEALRLLQHMRDEAHRFAQHYHHTLRRKRTLEEDAPRGRRPGKRRQGHRPTEP